MEVRKNFTLIAVSRSGANQVGMSWGWIGNMQGYLGFQLVPSSTANLSGKKTEFALLTGPVSSVRAGSVKWNHGGPPAPSIVTTRLDPLRASSYHVGAAVAAWAATQQPLQDGSLQTLLPTQALRQGQWLSFCARRFGTQTQG